MDYSTTTQGAVQTFDVTSVRKDFPLLSRSMHGQPLAFLDNAASSQKPAAVIEAMDRYYRHEHANVHRGVYQISAEATDAFEQARHAAQRFLNAGSHREIIFTKGATDSINLVASCFERGVLKAGDEVVITHMEHHSNIVPWQIACEQAGAKVRAITVTESGELDLRSFESLLNERTRMVALVHISNTLGTINPVEQIIERAHSMDIPVLLDGAQAAPHQRVDVRALDVDFYACSAHKMYGPTGIGILYGKEAWLDRLPPYQGGGEMIREVRIERTEYNELPFKFEAGTPNIAGVIGLGATIDYLEKMDWSGLHEHEQTLLQHATDQLLRIDGLRIIGTAPERASLVSFVVDGVHPHDIGTLLDQQGIAVRTGHHCTEPLMHHFGLPGTVRASFAMYNTTEEIDRLVTALRKAVTMLR